MSNYILNLVGEYLEASQVIHLITERHILDCFLNWGKRSSALNFLHERLLDLHLNYQNMLNWSAGSGNDCNELLLLSNNIDVIRSSTPMQYDALDSSSFKIKRGTYGAKNGVQEKLGKQPRIFFPYLPTHVYFEVTTAAMIL